MGARLVDEESRSGANVEQPPRRNDALQGFKPVLRRAAVYVFVRDVVEISRGSAFEVLEPVDLVELGLRRKFAAEQQAARGAAHDVVTIFRPPNVPLWSKRVATQAANGYAVSQSRRAVRIAFTS